MLTHKPQSCLASNSTFFYSVIFHWYTLCFPRFRFPQLSVKPLNVRKLTYPPQLSSSSCSPQKPLSPLPHRCPSVFSFQSKPLPTMLSSSSSETPLFQSSLSLATPLFPVQQKSLFQQPQWQGGHVLATCLSSSFPLEVVLHSQIKCPVPFG